MSASPLSPLIGKYAQSPRFVSWRSDKDRHPDESGSHDEEGPPNSSPIAVVILSGASRRFILPEIGFLDLRVGTRSRRIPLQLWHKGKCQRSGRFFTAHFSFHSTGLRHDSQKSPARIVLHFLAASCQPFESRVP